MIEVKELSHIQRSKADSHKITVTNLDKTLRRTRLKCFYSIITYLDQTVQVQVLDRSLS